MKNSRFFYLKKYGARLKEKKCLQLLFFVLISIKSCMSFDMLGIACGMDYSRAKMNQSAGMVIPVDVLNELGCNPKIKFVSAGDLQETIGDSKNILIDASEQRTNRPQADEAQKDSCSGKKKSLH